MFGNILEVEKVIRFTRGLSHPLRLQIVLLVQERQVGKANPVEISARTVFEELGESLSTVSYHMRFLHDHQILKLERTKPVRGAVQHFYALEDWASKALTRLLKELS